MLINSQKTMYGINLTINQLTGKPHKDLINTTLNEKFNIYALEEIPEDKYPTLRYQAIGVGGTDIIDNSNYKFSKHTAIDAALFEHIPFAMKPVTDDLATEDRLKYRFRVIENIDGVDYACYYLKVIPNIVNRDGLFQVDTVGEINTLKYMNTNRSDLLNPTPRLVTDYLDYEKNVYYAKTAKVEFSLYQEELANIQEASILRYGEIKNITEIALCTGFDKAIGATGDILEATNVTVTFFAEVDINTEIYLSTNKSLIRSIEIGSIEAYIDGANIVTEE